MIESPHDFISGMLNAAKSGGKLIFSVPNNATSGSFQRDYLNYPPHHISRWGKSVFEKATVELGFKLVDYQE